MYSLKGSLIGLFGAGKSDYDFQLKNKKSKE
jgi:hypothetical protein